ncbi:MAG: hypothetical protein K2K91_05735 [Ruminococcus sp.]|nr:hypothetical protein [Ruminococcus sp.]
MQSIKIPNIFGNVSKTGFFSPAVFLFNFAYCIYLFVMLLNVSFFAMYISRPMLKVTIVLVLLLLIGSVLFSMKFTVKSALMLGITGFLLMIIYLRMMTRIDYLPIFLLLFCGRNIKPEKIAKMTVFISIAVLLLVLVSALVGIIPNYVSVDYVSGELRIRHYLGFRYALQPPAILFNIISMDLYLHRHKLSIYRSLFWGISSYMMYLYTDSRLSCVFSLAVIAGFLIINRLPELPGKLKITKILMVGSFIICSIISFTVTYKYNPTVKWMRELNEILESRLRLGNDGFHDYGLKLFGQNINFIGNGLSKTGEKSVKVYNYIDCFYENILLKYGIIFFVIVIVGLTIASYISMKRKDYYLLWLMTLMAAHAMIDDLVLLLNYNTLWFFIMPMILKLAYYEMLVPMIQSLFQKRKRKLRFKLTS